MRANSSYMFFLFLPFLVISLWGCAATDTSTQLASLDETPLASSEPTSFNQEEPSITEDVTVPEPEITIAEEIKELENLGDWEAGTPEKIPAQAEVTYDFPVTMNKQVEYYLNFFQHKHKISFTRWLERSGRYLPMIQKELRQAGLPEDLAYLPMIESGYSLTAYSRAKAAGPWQFIRSTGKNYGLIIDSYVDERRDPEKATRAAIAFLSDLYEQFGDWQLSVAGYNAGGRKISRTV